MTPVIQIRNVSKRYQLGEKERLYGSFREALIRTVRKPWDALRNGSRDHLGSTSRDWFWALHNIDLDVHCGDTVGIIGSNGAGKSTLLKILSRITEPTEGQVRIRGRLASLLEVGTGFHPELTGRENIYLNGAILGMTKSEIDSKFDEITEFSEIGKFLDTPVKRYSSGMYVRLAFAIAAHLEAETLIVDEVLAVGDVSFQRKCMRKMEEARAKARTVLFVSHNLAAIESLCTRSVVLSGGTVVFAGDTKEAVRFYLHDLGGDSGVSDSNVIDLTCAPGRASRYAPQLTSLELYTSEGRPVLGSLPIGAPLKAIIRLNLQKPCKFFYASVAFDTLSGQRICTAHSAYEPNLIPEQRVGEQTFVCEILSLPLVPGEYKVGVGLDIGNQEEDWVDDVIRLTITSSDYYGTGIVPVKGSFLLQNRWMLGDGRGEASRNLAKPLSTAV